MIELVELYVHDDGWEDDWGDVVVPPENVTPEPAGNDPTTPLWKPVPAIAMYSVVFGSAEVGVIELIRNGVENDDNPFTTIHVDTRELGDELSVMSNSWGTGVVQSEGAVVCHPYVPFFGQ